MLFFGCSFALTAQKHLRLDLTRTIQLANDSSLEAFRVSNMYLSGYWDYQTYKANRLPSLTMYLTPAQYYRDITKRYDSQRDLDVYRTQQSFYSDGNFTLKQNFDLTGGSFYMVSDLAYIRNFGYSKSTQYTSVPIRIGYSQDLLGYNPFKWERCIEPLKYERAKKEFIYNTEKVAEQATSYFFALAMAQTECDMATKNVASADTLFSIGEQRFKIAAISQADLLTLKLDRVNAHNTLQNKMSELKRAMFSLATFLNLDKNTNIDLDLPVRPKEILISLDKALNYMRCNNPKSLELKQNILEAEQKVDRTKKESRFNASVNASIGFNQVADKFANVYSKPMQQDLVSISLSIPLIDWGVSKGKYNMARNSLNVVKISAKQEEVNMEEEVIMAVNDFNVQQKMIASAEEALDLSILAYNETRRRFIIGKTDINSLTLSLNRQQEAQKNYITALQNYWQNYYKIQRLTLFDFSENLSLAEKFDFNGGKFVE